MGTVSTGGAWLPSELTLHINVKAMIAILYALRSFVDKLENLHICVLSDNTTAVSVVNKMGTMRSPECNTVAHMAKSITYGSPVPISRGLKM